MNPISAFFVRNIIVVFFFYGLAFFVMGIALALASRRTSELRFAQAIRPLAAFGILHGIHEWIEMFQKIASFTSGYVPGLAGEILRLGVLVASFIMLLVFGSQLLAIGPGKGWRPYLPIGLMVGVWGLSVAAIWWAQRPSADELVALADVLARYALGIPGGLLGTWALMDQQRTFRAHDLPQFGRDLVWAAAALFLYGVVGQIFVRQTILFPSQIVNSTFFLQQFGVPVQLFRGVMAAMLTFYLMRALQAFELESQRQLDRANQAQLAARTRAQEAERQRIARELHDATGQSLTAIALGLRGLGNAVSQQSPALSQQMEMVEGFATDALGELRHLIADLRPPQLDDLGLVPAIRWYVRTFQRRYPDTKVDLHLVDVPARLPPEAETVIFRIVQEAMTNVAKHAQASRVTVTLEAQPTQIHLAVVDNGVGFTPAAPGNPGPQDSQTGGWGLLGIQERAAQLGGTCRIESSRGQGVQIHLTVPWSPGAMDPAQKPVQKPASSPEKDRGEGP